MSLNYLAFVFVFRRHIYILKSDWLKNSWNHLVSSSLHLTKNESLILSWKMILCGQIVFFRLRDLTFSFWNQKDLNCLPQGLSDRDCIDFWWKLDTFLSVSTRFETPSKIRKTNVPVSKTFYQSRVKCSHSRIYLLAESLFAVL